MGFGRNSAWLYADEMIHGGSVGNPWGNVSHSLEGRGSDALGRISMEVGRCQSVGIQMQVGGKVCWWGTRGTSFRVFLLSQRTKNQSQQRVRIKEV